MSTDFFTTLLEELSKALSISELHPDASNGCTLHFKNDVSVQLQLENSGEFLCMVADLGEVSPGSYRQELAEAALKSNGNPTNSLGVFAYSNKNQHIIFFHRMSLHQLNGEKVLNALLPFVEKAHEWKEAISKSEIPVSAKKKSTSPGLRGLFGM